jgi:hypothetical protein
MDSAPAIGGDGDEIFSSQRGDVSWIGNAFHRPDV